MVVAKYVGRRGGTTVVVRCDGPECLSEATKRGTHAQRALTSIRHLCKRCNQVLNHYVMTVEVKAQIKATTLEAMRDPDVKQRMRDNQPDRSGTNNSFFGRAHTAEARKKISENNPYTGKCNPWWRPWMMEGRKRWGDIIRRFFGDCCAMCSITRPQLRETSIKLDAHHVAPVATHPELRYDFNNGIALCRPCHNHAHRLMKDDPSEYEKVMKELFNKRETYKAARDAKKGRR